MLSLFWADRPQVSVQTLDIKITYLISDNGNNNYNAGFSNRQIFRVSTLFSNVLSLASEEVSNFSLASWQERKRKISH